METVRADWDANRYRSDLWLYGESGTLAPLAHSGHDHSPEWSADGRWVAFLSDRATGDPRDDKSTSRPAESEEKPASQVYVISTVGGEAVPVTHGDEDVHAFAWSADSNRIFFATRTPWTRERREANYKEWNDVVQFRESERGDKIFDVDVPAALTRLAWPSESAAPKLEPREIASTPYRVKQLGASPDGRWLAFSTDSRSLRVEALEPYGIYLVELASGAERKLSQKPALYDDLHWSPDSRKVFTRFEAGSVEEAYKWMQWRVYELPLEARIAGAAGPLRDQATAAASSAPLGMARWASRFGGSISSYAVAPSGGLVAAGILGTEVQPYTQENLQAEFIERRGVPGEYGHFSAAAHSSRLAFSHSSLQEPPEVYLAESIEDISHARAITSFNHFFTERDLPRGKPYRWTADDGTSVEGMLVYPPGKLGARSLRTFTFIHGGPDEAEGNHFQADWDEWAILAATQGWLVFEPNYRGSLGYGDKFQTETVPALLSRPGKDILEGVDALVKDGIADADHLTIGGYSEGSSLTNWLITQTTRFKAAVTGAGAAEHAVNWGNDDETFDDAYTLGGVPWEAKKNYDAEAPLWQIAKVRTPTHIVAGADDVRVYVGENYLLERALFTLGVPVKLLIFPGEGHSLDKNPWHGKIKVREELKWMETYGGR